MKRRHVLAFLVLAVAQRSPGTDAAEPAFQPTTAVSLSAGLWQFNGKPTYAGSPAEGLLLNVRMVHAVFEDRAPETCPDDFDANANTTRFVEKIPDYVRHGVRAFTLNLQGGDPGYAKPLNSAYDRDGGIDAAYLARVARVVEACDREGAAVILGCFSRWQDRVLRDEAAIEKAVVATATWIHDRGYRNVLLEIADGVGHSDFHHDIFREASRIKDLIAIARRAAPRLLVSASGPENGRAIPAMASASDFILLHFDKVPPDAIFGSASRASKYAKAIVCNADTKTDDKAVAALDAAVDSLCSWGYANAEQNERYPFRFTGAADDPRLYLRLKELTTPRSKR